MLMLMGMHLQLGKQGSSGHVIPQLALLGAHEGAEGTHAGLIVRFSRMVLSAGERLASGCCCVA
jgi:hypothetical protein